MDKIAGIYKITNKQNHKVYIGESEDIERRWIQHKESLNNGDHHNWKLQQDYNTYGLNNFKFEILEKLSDYDSVYKEKFQLILLENKYIKQYDSINNGYNIENTVEKILLGKKTIFTINDRPYLYSLIRNNKINDLIYKLYDTYMNENDNTIALHRLIRTYELYQLKELCKINIIKMTKRKFIFNDKYLDKGLFHNDKEGYTTDNGLDFLNKCLDIYDSVYKGNIEDKDYINFLIS